MSKRKNMSQLGPHLYSEGDSEKNIIESATELFEIDDFTSPSSWEKFVSQLEHIFRDWDLHKVSKNRPTCPQFNWPWRVRSQNLTFYDFEFQVSEFSRQNPAKRDTKSDLEDDEVDETELSR